MAIGALVASMAASILSVYSLIRARETAIEAVGDARDALSGLSEYRIEAMVPINTTFPVSVEVPLSQEFIVPIRTTIPFTTTVRVPIEIPLFGTYEINVPVETEVPVDLQVVVPVSQSMPINTAIALNLEIPVQLDMGQLGLESLLTQFDSILGRIESQLLQFPPLSAEADDSD
jgi:hypothetical protein